MDAWRAKERAQGLTIMLFGTDNSFARRRHGSFNAVDFCYENISDGERSDRPGCRHFLLLFMLNFPRANPPPSLPSFFHVLKPDIRDNGCARAVPNMVGDARQRARARALSSPRVPSTLDSRFGSPSDLSCAHSFGRVVERQLLRLERSR